MIFIILFSLIQTCYVGDGPDEMVIAYHVNLMDAGNAPILTKNVQNVLVQV